MRVTVPAPFKSLVDALMVMPVIVPVTEEELGAVGELLSPRHAASRGVVAMRYASYLGIQFS